MQFDSALKHIQILREKIINELYYPQSQFNCHWPAHSEPFVLFTHSIVFRDAMESRGDAVCHFLLISRSRSVHVFHMHSRARNPGPIIHHTLVHVLWRFPLTIRLGMKNRAPNTDLLGHLNSHVPWAQSKAVFALCLWQYVRTTSKRFTTSKDVVFE